MDISYIPLDPATLEELRKAGYTHFYMRGMKRVHLDPKDPKPTQAFVVRPLDRDTLPHFTHKWTEPFDSFEVTCLMFELPSVPRLVEWV
ncbi:MAG: hypothetical protein EOP49_29875 [Sphingobacteriales bacterium]|nr:MAG: hypothetical protein EOP49_29875 [Sphingobacteriales bacterium]